MHASEVIKLLDLALHPEGGHYRQTFRDTANNDGRSVGTAIYYLLKSGEVSHWHRVDAAEIWHFYSGAPLELHIHDGGSNSQVIQLGPDIATGQRPQAVVPAQSWQSAKSLGEWTLVGCTVSPGFEFSGFEMAPPNWAPY